MIRRALLPAIAAILLVASAAVAKTETVKVGDDFFSPKKAKIHKNDRIAFEWIGENEHDIVKTKGPGGFFESGPLTGSGVLYKHKFKKPGDYKLICSIHQDMTMKVEVKR
jgi:plastocyanin